MLETLIRHPAADAATVVAIACCVLIDRDYRRQVTARPGGSIAIGLACGALVVAIWGLAQ